MTQVNGGTKVSVVSLAKRLWADDCGALLATEWVVVATIMVLGIIPGLIAIRQGVLSELVDFGDATTALDQSYGFTGQKLACDPTADDPRHATNDANLADKMTATGALSVRTGADPVVSGGKVHNDKLHRGGVQAFTGGSGFVETRNFDGNGKSQSIQATPVTPSTANSRPCD